MYLGFLGMTNSLQRESGGGGGWAPCGCALGVWAHFEDVNKIFQKAVIIRQFLKFSLFLVAYFWDIL